jgi:hypothetical protein
VRGCPLRLLISRCFPRQLELIVGAAVGRDRAAGAIAAQSLELCCRRCFYFCLCCCQFLHRQPCRPCLHRSSLCRHSLAFLCRGNVGLLSVLRTRGDRALGLSFVHGVLVGGCCVGKRLSQTSCCLSVQERRDEQRQLVLLLPAEDRGKCGKGMSRRCLGCRIERL